MRPHLPVLAALTLLTGCSDPATGPVGEADLALEVVATGLNNPVLVTAAPDDPTRLFIVEKGGTIRIVRDGAVLATPFLDVRGKVSNGGEQGLLGMAFHPRYSTNGVVVGYYTELSGDTRVVSWRVTSDPDQLDPDTEQLILAVDQPFPNHNGGHVTFGPIDYLWIGLGDGGGAGDPTNRGQNRNTVLGKLVRLIITDQGTGTIPPGNPFVGQPNHRWEIWSLGLRNPWRFSFDPVTGILYLGDVGQNTQEEINVSPDQGRGTNYGWRLMEGTRCFNPPNGCDFGGLWRPTVTYDHDQGCTVIGGHVYRGPAIPEIDGLYFYADYCAGWVRSFRYQNGIAQEQVEWPDLAVTRPTSFGIDAVGELYIASESGTIYRVVRR